MSGPVRSLLRHGAAAFELRPNATIVAALSAAVVPLVVATLWASGVGAGDSRLAGMIGAVAVVGAALASAAIVTAAASDLPADRRRSWQLTAAGLLLYAAGAATWFLTLRGSSSPATTGPGDLAYLAAMVCFAAATLRHPLMRPRSRMVRACIDAAIVAASITVWLWLAAGRHLLRDTGDHLGTAACMLFPAVDVFIVVLCLTASARPRIEQRSMTSGLLLAAAFSGLLVGDVAQAFIRSYGADSQFPLVVEAAWVASFVFLAAVSWVARGTSKAVRVPWARQQLAVVVTTVPALFAVIATVVTVTDATQRGRVDATAMLVLMAVVALALVRQSLTVADNMRLGDSLRSAVDELEQQATHDALTNLPNRAGLIDRIDAALRRAERDGTSCAVLFVDLDHLKAVNDSLGHSAGDDLLRTVSSRLTARVGGGVTRFGGDEFVVLLERLPTASTALRLGVQIVDDSSAPMTTRGYQFRPSVSVGVGLAEPGLGPEELLRRADVALYHAKSLGRRCAAEYEPSLDVAARRHVDLEPELRRALDQDEFEVHYQPVVDLATDRVVGVESLLRWRHPERGLLLPAAFLDEATANGMLAEIGRRTLLQVCADFGTGSHEAFAGLDVAVNLSTSELVDDRVVERVGEALDGGGLTAERLIIEITEDVIVDDTIRRTIDRLRGLGVELSIDDFGTGNSSLRQLGAYPASTLKIDRSFVERLPHDPQAEAITRAILGVARNLGLRTIAEGVETDGQAGLLRSLGCDLAQGWRYARAMPLDELVAFVAARRTSMNVGRPGVVPPAPAQAGPDQAGPDQAGPDQAERRASVASASEMIESSSSATGGRSSITPTT